MSSPKDETNYFRLMTVLSKTQRWIFTSVDYQQIKVDEKNDFIELYERAEQELIDKYNAQQKNNDSIRTLLSSQSDPFTLQ